MTESNSAIRRPFSPGSSFGRHLVSQRADPADGDLPPVATYQCLRLPGSDGSPSPIDPDIWDAAEWSAPFAEITGEAAAVRTRIAMLWDDTNLYVSYRVAGPHRPPAMDQPRDHVYIADDAVEFFIEGSGYYYEIGRNVDNIGYEVRWAWMEHLVERQNFEELESWLTLGDYIYYRKRKGERIGRIGDMDYELPGLTTTIDDVTMSDDLVDGWTATFTFPWESLAQSLNGPWPPSDGDTVRMAGYRIHQLLEPTDRTSESHVWSVMGNRDIHNPERWTVVTFSGATVPAPREA
jgi:hypothetical protein